jgi:uncharacterized protein (TIGR02996 family)
MTEEKAFLQAILSQPDEDTPRLIFADWLEEQGDPRGELIRLLCALAPLGRWDPQRPALETQAQELLQEHAAAWLGELASVALAWKFERGLPVLTVRAADFLTHGEMICQEYGVQAVRLIDTAPHIKGLAACPHLAGLASLDLSHQFDLHDREIAILAASPYLTHLTALDIGYTMLGDVGLGALAASPYLARLTRLTVSFGQTTSKGIAALTTSKHLAQLRHLALDKNPLGNDGIIMLAAWPALENLASLDLSSTKLGYDGTRAICTSPHLMQMESLSLGNNRLGQATWIGSQGLASILQEAHFPHLTKLMLGSNELYDQIIVALAAAPLLGPVQELYLASNQIRDQGIVALAASPLVAQLQGLVLSANAFGEVGVIALAESPYLTNLHYLSMSCAMTHRALDALGSSASLPQGMKLKVGLPVYMHPNPQVRIARERLLGNLWRRFDLLTEL